jgi:CubicO group peptidase (beta-lactamase class C family)
LGAALFASVNPAYAGSTPDDFSQVDAYMAETMRSLPIKGAALAIVQGDQILYMHGYGVANAQGDPATAQTPWPMASVTKSFTALAIQQLAQAGKVDLDAPLQTYLPEFRLADPQTAAKITVRDLLDHTSGISTVEGNQPYVHSPQTTLDQALSQVAHYRPAYPPGAHYEYSNLNYVLLGPVITRASGLSYTDYVQQNILAPLGMTHSTFADFHTLPQAASGNLIAYGFPIPYNEKYVPLMLPAGYLTATAQDMARYLTLFFGKGQVQGQRLLPWRDSGWYDPWWNWHVGTPAPDLVYGFSGGHSSISTTCLLYPRQGVGVVLLLNTRLDEISPAITSFDIALGIGNLITGQPYQLPSNRGFYTFWMLVDGILLLLLVSFIWQALKLRRWRKGYQAARRIQRSLAWVGIGLDLLICIGILVLPGLMNTAWNSMIAFRPDFGIPLLLLAIGLGVIGLTKAAINIVTLVLSP